MDEGFEVGAVDTVADVSDVTFEPLDVAGETVLEPIMDTQELTELQQEAETLEIQPLDDGIDLGYDYDEAIREANEIVEEQPYESSALSNIINAGAEGLTSPSGVAQLASEISGSVPPGAEEVVAQGLQAGWNMGVAGSEEMMEATINQHGRSPSVEYNDMLIQQAIEAGRQPEFSDEP